MGSAELLQERLCQQYHVLAPFSYRWQGQDDHGQPVIQVSAQASSGDAVVQIGIGRRDDFDVYQAIGHGPEAPHAFALQRGQELAL